MELFSIGIKDKYEEVKKMLERQLELFKGEGFNIDMESNIIGGIFFFRYKINDKNNGEYWNVKDMFRHNIASTISDIILDIYQEKIINNMINDRYYYFNQEDRSTIIKKVLESLNQTDCITKDGMVIKLSRRARILKTLIEYLELNDEIIIEGFINFRLRFFKDLIEDAVERAAEEIIIEKEYKEFIKILQYFVDIQEPKVNLVNILIKENKNYILYDDNNKIISNDFLKEIADELIESDINFDDLLISSLITLAPRQIKVHIATNEDNIEIVKIIENVFGDRVSICTGCELCHKDKNIKSQVNKEN